MNLELSMYDVSGCTTEIWPEYGKHWEVHHSEDKKVLALQATKFMYHACVANLQLGEDTDNTIYL
jgi:hypothetical protein